MIKIKDLTFSYSSNKPLFDKANFTIPIGKVYGLLGKNGAGKSSLINLITGVYLPKKGDCFVLGENTKNRNPFMLKETMVVPETFQMPNLSIEQFLKMNALFYSSLNKKLFFKCLEEIDLKIDNPKQKMNNFSYGQSKKLMICFAIATNCKIIIMDEPTNGLDIPSKKKFRDIIFNHLSKKKRTLIISTHLIKDVEEILDSVFFLENGRQIFQADLEEINNKLIVSASKKEPKTALYIETKKDGFMSLNKKSKTTKNNNMDIEFLFNAVLEKSDEINQLWG